RRLACAGAAARRPLAAAVAAGEPRMNEPPAPPPPLSALGRLAGVGERGLRFQLDRCRDTPGLHELSEPDGAGMLVFAHQALQHEGKERERVGLALDLGLQTL